MKPWNHRARYEDPVRHANDSSSPGGQTPAIASESAVFVAIDKDSSNEAKDLHSSFDGVEWVPRALGIPFNRRCSALGWAWLGRFCVCLEQFLSLETETAMAPECPPRPQEQAAPVFQKHRTRLITLVFTDLVDSTAILSELGDQAGATLMKARRQVIRDTLQTVSDAEEIETAGDSFLLAFARPSDAVRFSLQVQARLRVLGGESELPVRDRIGIHMGEVVISERETEVKAKNLYGIQLATCARVMSLAQGGQVLLTRGVFDNARQVLKGEDLPGVGPLSWLSHGTYLVKGTDEPVEVCEVGEVGANPLAGPKTSEKARRCESAETEPVLGWRPAVGQELPNTQWRLERKLGEGGFGEVWLGRHRTLKEHRVFKFCFRADRVRSLKRETTLFRILKERVGDHPHIVRLLEVNFEQAPFYVVTDHVEGQELRSWCEIAGRS